MVVTVMVAMVPDGGKSRSSNNQEQEHSDNFLHAKNLA